MKKCDEVIAIHWKKRATGVYVFLNPIQKKVYVGETIDNFSRFEQHLKGMVVDSEDSNGTNKNLKEEEFKTFEVEFFGVSKKEKEDLLDYETALMCICREKGLKLYNGGKDDKDNIPGREYLISDEGNVEWKECKNRVNIYIEYDIDNKYQEIKDMFELWLDNSGYSDDFFKKDRENREKEWSQRVKVLKDSEDYYLVSSSGKINGKKTLNKEDMDKCNINGIGINDLLTKYNTDYAVWSPFGMYVAQGPITILETKQHDIEKLELARPYENDDKSFTIKAKEDVETEGICVWSLSNYGLEYMRKQLASTKNNGEAFYGKRLLFLPYTSSNKAVNVSSISLDIEKRDDENIEAYHKRLKKKQTKYFATSCRIDEKGEEITFPKEMFPEVLRLDSNRGSMAFLISKFYYINDINSSNIEKFKSAIQVTYKDGDDKKLKDAYTIAPCSIINSIDEDIINEATSSNRKKDEVVLIAAVLEYPYVVRISNTPNLSLYLKEVCDNSKESIPSLLFNVTGIENNRIENGIVKCAYAFNGDEVYVFNDGETRMGDLIAEKEDDDNSDNKILECIKKQVKINDDNAKKGKYRLSFEVKDNIRYEVINIIVDGKEEKIRLNCKKQFTPRAMPHDLYKYYCFENGDDNEDDNNSIWAFRYKYLRFDDVYGYKEKRKNNRPLFVFDDESEFS